ncbi:MAG: hypothetical protein FH751_01360 [Firmicutes bacterium]|nr:hypothetical protein [Bacillota bacterium]
MKTKILFIIMISLVLNLYGCDKKNSLKAEEISKVKIIFSEKSSEGKHCIELSQNENIKKMLNTYKKLKTKENFYDKTGCKIKVQYVMKSGKLINDSYKLENVDGIFKDIFNTLEVKKQTIDIFKINPSNIKKVKFESPLDRKVWESNDIKVIKKAYENTLIHFKNRNYYGKRDFFKLAYVDFFNNEGQIIAGGLVLRKDNQWDQMFRDYPEFNELLISPKEVKNVKLTTRKRNKKITVTDDEIIEKIINTYKIGSTNKSEVSVEIVLKNDFRTHLYGSYNKGEIPNFISDLLNYENNF